MKSYSSVLMCLHNSKIFNAIFDKLAFQRQMVLLFRYPCESACVSELYQNWAQCQFTKVGIIYCFFFSVYVLKNYPSLIWKYLKNT